MPPRRRPKAPPLDPVSRFGAILRESQEREKAELDRKRRERQEAKEAAQAVADHTAALKAARSELQRAIDAVRAARSKRSGVAEADAAWRLAKARLIELETGAPPAWTPTVAGPEPPAAEVPDESPESDQ